MAAKSVAAASSSSASPNNLTTTIIKLQPPSFLSEDIPSLVDSLKEQVVADRQNFIKDRIEENKKKLVGITNHIHNLSKSRKNAMSTDIDVTGLLTQRKETILCSLNGLDISYGEKDTNGCMEDNSNISSSVLLGNNFGGKNSFRPIKLEEVAKLPPYTTWIFLDRNQRMTEDQSIVGRRRIYYDQNCGEALICSDSEEEVIEDEEEKGEFGNGEDYILRKAIEQAGLSDPVLDFLARYFDRKPCGIKARYENLFKVEKIDPCIKKRENEAEVRSEDAFKEKDLEAALDSFDNLFCRRCLVFDCRLHGCSQDLVFPAEKQVPWANSDEGIACGSQCYRVVSQSENIALASSPIRLVEETLNSSGSAGLQLSPGKRTSATVGRKLKFQQSESASSNAKIRSESSESEVSPHQPTIHQKSSSPSKIKLGGKGGSTKKGITKRVSERVLVSTQKKQKRTALSDSDSVVSGYICQKEIKYGSNSRKVNKDVSCSQKINLKSLVTRKARKKESPVHIGHNSNGVASIYVASSEIAKAPPAEDGCESSSKEEFVVENVHKHEAMGDTSWEVIEKSLFAKGLEIFGRNSCLIARNLLNGMKTCKEIFQYMNFIESKSVDGNGDGIGSQVNGYKGNELRRRSRFLRRRGRVRRLKYTWKSTGYHSIRKRISERKDQPCRQYNPCSCQSACGKQCSCLLNGTCCEKYCGCPKICKNRFRGCHCAKSQCRSRQCPCFAANRECDPDICRNCWVGCGDGSFGGPIQRGDNYECRNMKLLLKQQQRVLLGRSDVSGWGAFLKNSVSKHEYLGEYTGELISHREADKRGKIYDRENSSFLFNLNDQFVLDAYRKGDKLKFANHSPDPNCYAKVIMVAGDHRVGIFAKERISAGEELFYDYRYEPDRAPAWARRPETSFMKKDDLPPSSGRAKKLA